MVVKVVATPSLNWLAKTKQFNDDVSPSRANWLGTMSSKLNRSRSFEFIKPNSKQNYPIRRACSASFASSSFSTSDDDAEFSRKIQELNLRFQVSDENSSDSDCSQQSESESEFSSSSSSPVSMDQAWEKVQNKSIDWNPVNIEMKANSVDIPLSLRIIKKKNQRLKTSNLSQASESACCSVKKAFSSMVFIIRELHSYSLQMREILFYEDLQGILSRVQNEMHTSFVWLFQQVFSHTPTLMVYVMILLANFTVHSISNSTTVATAPPQVVATVEETITLPNIDSVKSFYLSSSPLFGSKTVAIGGNNGGGNNVKPVGSGMENDGWMNKLSININRPIMPDGVSPFRTTREGESVSVSVSVSGQEELTKWNSILDEASRMQGEFRDEALDDDVAKRLVSPVKAKIEADGYVDYFRTELLYQSALAHEPKNVLLLANYAQFLYLVIHDYDRAEEYFKRAIKVEPKDAEAHNKYANFLWQIRNDLWAAEETYLEAISADPSNSFYAANYAHFLWNTGGEDTCFPLDSPDDEALDV